MVDGKVSGQPLSVSVTDGNASFGTKGIADDKILLIISIRNSDNFITKKTSLFG